MTLRLARLLKRDLYLRQHLEMLTLADQQRAAASIPMPPPPAESMSAPQQPSRQDLATWCLTSRRLRQEIFPSELVMGPAWDIMLDLYILRESGTKVKKTSVSPITGLASSTAGRWIRRLVAEGFVESSADRSDRRRSYIVLSNQGAGLMDRFFNELGKSGSPGSTAHRE